MTTRENIAAFAGTLLASFLATMAAADTVVSPVLLERRNQIEYDNGNENLVGELTYTVGSDARPNLYLGTAENGTQVVSDPFAIHQPKTELTDSENFAVEFVSDGIQYLEDGSVSVFRGEAYATNQYTRTLRFRTIDGKRISAVRWEEVNVDNAGISFARNDDGSCDLKVVSHFINMYDSAPTVTIKDFKVYVFAGDRTKEEADLVAGDILLHDSMGDVYFSKLREWTANRYDDKTAIDWARYKANHDVYLEGYRVFFNKRCSLLTSMSGTNDTASLRFMANGSAVMEIIPGEVSSDSELRVVKFEYNTTNVVLWAVAQYESPVYVQSAPGVRDVYEDMDGVVSSYPDKETVTANGQTLQAYRLVIPVDPAEDARFYRLKQEATGSGGTAVNLYGDVRLNGRTVDDAIKDAIKRLVTTGLVIDGVRYTVQATETPEN